MSISFLGSIHDGTNQSGTLSLQSLSTSSRYKKFRSSDLLNLNLYNKISSAVVYPTNGADGTMIFFGYPNFNWFSFPDFQGYYVQLTNRKGSSGAQEIDNFSSHSLNDGSQSMIFVGPNKGGFEIRLSFRDLFLTKWNTFLDSALSGSSAKRNGNPTLTWEMWPNSISYLSPNSRYLKIHQKLNIEIDWWPDYDATITYHVYLYLNSSGTLKGHVSRWAYWVESGIKSSAIGKKLRPKVISGAGDLTTELNNEFSAYSAFSFDDLYYLPGRQLSRAPNGVKTGWTTDDTTIVLVL